MSFIHWMLQPVAPRVQAAVVATAIGFSSLAAWAGPADFDPTFNPPSGKVVRHVEGKLSNTAKTMAVLPDGKIVVVGSIHRSGFDNDDLISVAVLNPDGTVFRGFGKNGTFTFSGGLLCAAVQPDGKIVVLGVRGTYPNVNYFLLRINADGEPDQSFGSGGTAALGNRDQGSSGLYLEAVGVQPDGKIVVAGTTVDFWLQHVGEVRRYTVLGLPDVDFGQGGVAKFGWERDHPLAIAFQTDGKILITGTRHGAYSREKERDVDSTFVLRFSDVGAPDETFGWAGGAAVIPECERVNAIAVGRDGRIFVAGQTAADWGSPLRTIESGALVFALSPDGTLDAAFGESGFARYEKETFDVAAGIALEPDGDVLVAGYSRFRRELEYRTTAFILRYTSEGNPDPAFGNNGAVTRVGVYEDSAVAVALSPDGGIVAAGTTASSLYLSNFLVLKLSSSGGSFPGFGDGAGRAVAGTAGWTWVVATEPVIQQDGKILVCAGVLGSTDVDLKLFRYRMDGTPDGAFGRGGVATYDGGGNELDCKAVVQRDGKIVAAVATNKGASPDYDLLVLRFNADGTLDTSFAEEGVFRHATGRGEEPYDLVLQPDGKIVVIGESCPLDYTSSRMLVLRLLPTGQLDPQFGGGSGTVTWSKGVYASPSEVALQSDGKIVVAYNSWDSEPVPTAPGVLVRFLPDGSLDGTFENEGVATLGGADMRIFSVALGPDGDILLAGRRRDPDTGHHVALVARFTSKGTLDGSFGEDGVVTWLNPDAYSEFYKVSLQPDGKVLLSGLFADPHPSHANYHDSVLARLEANGSRDVAFGQGGLLTFDLGPVEVLLHALQPDGKIVLAGTAEDDSLMDYPLVVIRLLGESPPPPQNYPLALLWPNGGEQLRGGRTYRLPWSSTEPAGAVRTTTRFSFTLDGGKTWLRASTVTGADGVVRWKAPAVLRTRRYCKLCVWVRDARGRVLAWDTSDRWFALKPPSQ